MFFLYSFTPEMLMNQCPKLGLVVDLTNTTRYYNGQVFQKKGIQYKKISCPGQIVPPGTILKE
ncbi:Tyrosine-protein phosphatase [Blattella germanica]|nr:Tyrosine-protein phosphatase [Blattella germanica]